MKKERLNDVWRTKSLLHVKHRQNDVFASVKRTQNAVETLTNLEEFSSLLIDSQLEQDSTLMYLETETFSSQQVTSKRIRSQERSTKMSSSSRRRSVSITLMKNNQKSSQENSNQQSTSSNAFYKLKYKSTSKLKLDRSSSRASSTSNNESTKELWRHNLLWSFYSTTFAIVKRALWYHYWLIRKLKNTMF